MPLVKKYHTVIRTSIINSIHETEEGKICVNTDENEYEFSGPTLDECVPQLTNQFVMFYDEESDY